MEYLSPIPQNVQNLDVGTATLLQTFKREIHNMCTNVYQRFPLTEVRHVSFPRKNS